VLLRNSFIAVAIAVGCLGLATEMVACSSSSGSGAAPVAEASIPVSSCVDGGLTVAFNPMYSAFDGKHVFQIPAVVRGSNTQVTWSADSTMVGMQTDNERPNEVLIQMLKPGNVLINVVSMDGKCGSAVLFISAAAESDWEIGNARYNDGQSLHLAAGATAGSGSPLEQGTMGGPACTSCHGETATTGPYTDVSHTPEQTGGFSDDDLLNIILRGDFPEGGYFDTSIANYTAWHNFHRWADITMDQQKGIITYLRSLTPADQKGSVNFGAFDDLESGTGNDQGDATISVETGTGEDAAIVDAGPDVVVVTDAAPVVDASDASDAATE
jgi:hypothetical protein